MVGCLYWDTCKLPYLCDTCINKTLQQFDEAFTHFEKASKEYLESMRQCDYLLKEYTTAVYEKLKRG